MDSAIKIILRDLSLKGCKYLIVDDKFQILSCLNIFETNETIEVIIIDNKTLVNQYVIHNMQNSYHFIGYDAQGNDNSRGIISINNHSGTDITSFSSPITLIFRNEALILNK
jgi:hypothetical protein